MKVKTEQKTRVILKFDSIGEWMTLYSARIDHFGPPVKPWRGGSAN